MSSSVRPRVVYIAGWGRSGSTLLDMALGSMPGVTSTGELRYLWSRGLQQGRLCGCGRAIPDCPMWTDVLDRVGAYPRPGAHLDADAVGADLRAAVRTRDTRGILAGRGDDRIVRLMDLHLRLYRAISEVAGTEVVVDSSKMPADAAALAVNPDVDLHLVHLVRDPRAVAWSWTRTKMMTDLAEPRPIGVHTPRRSTLQWLVWNVLVERVAAHATSTTFVRYEDFVDDPSAVLGTVAAEVGVDESAAASVVRDGRIQIRPSHTVSGNPDRFRTGSVAVRRDDEWRRAQPQRDRWVATVLALPRLRRYGYSLRP